MGLSVYAKLVRKHIKSINLFGLVSKKEAIRGINYVEESAKIKIKNLEKPKHEDIDMNAINNTNSHYDQFTNLMILS